MRAYLDNERPDLAKQAAEDFGANGYELGASIAARLRKALGEGAPGAGAAAEPAAVEGSGADLAAAEAAASAGAVGPSGEVDGAASGASRAEAGETHRGS